MFPFPKCPFSNEADWKREGIQPHVLGLLILQAAVVLTKVKYLVKHTHCAGVFTYTDQSAASVCEHVYVVDTHTVQNKSHIPQSFDHSF